MSAKEKLKVRVVSNGTVKGTTVTDVDTGKEVPFASFDLALKTPRAGHYPEKGEVRASLTLMPGPVDVVVDAELNRIGHFSQVTMEGVGAVPVRLSPIVLWFAKQMDRELTALLASSHSAYASDPDTSMNALIQRVLQKTGEAIDTSSKSGDREAAEAAVYLMLMASKRPDVFSRPPEVMQ